MLAPGRDLTVDEVAEELGLPVAMIRRRIDAGDLPVRWVEVDGRLEVRVPAPGTDGRPAAEPRTGQPDPATPPRASSGRGGTDRGTASDHLPGEASVALAGTVEVGRPGLAPLHPTGLTELDTREVVAGLFDRWEQALERRIEAEQRLRFEAELERRSRQLRELHTELDGARRAHAEEVAGREREAIALRAQLRALEAQEARRRPWWRRG